jgi:hypothetical protein
MLNALSNALMEGHLIFATKRLNPNEVNLDHNNLSAAEPSS